MTEPLSSIILTILQIRMFGVLVDRKKNAGKVLQTLDTEIPNPKNFIMIK